MGGTHFLQTGYLLLNRNAPLSLHMYEARYFNAKCSVENYNEDEIPACIKICEALGIKTVSYEWSKDYYGRQNSDEIKLTYTI